MYSFQNDKKPPVPVSDTQAAEDTYVKTDELTDNDTAAPKKDSVIPSKNQ